MCDEGGVIVSGKMEMAETFLGEENMGGVDIAIDLHLRAWRS